MTYVTITIVGIFFFLNLPRVFMGGYEVGKMHLVLHCAEYKEDYHPQMWYYKVDNICRFLMVLNSSINFLIYCIGNEQFKVWSQQCHQLFARHLKKITILHWLASLKDNFWMSFDFSLWERPPFFCNSLMNICAFLDGVSRSIQHQVLSRAMFRKNFYWISYFDCLWNWRQWNRNVDCENVEASRW